MSEVIVNLRMRKRFLETQSIRVNLLVLFILIFLLAILYFDLKCSSNKFDSNKIVGTVVYKMQNIQKKNASSPVWEEIEVESQIKNLDTIKSDPYSKVTIRMADNTEIQLEENSMVVINTSKEIMNIRFLYGAIRVNTMESDHSNEVKITSDNKIKIEDKSDVRLTKNSGIEINVNEGNAQVDIQGNLKEVKKEETVSVYANTFQTKKQTIKLSYPENAKYMYVEKDTNEVNLKWNTTESANEYTLELFDSEKPAVPLVKSTTKENSFKAKLPRGSYTWKVSSGDTSSETYKFFLIQDLPVLLHTPADKANYYYTTELPRIIFDWQKHFYAERYTLEISNAKDFNSIVYTIATVEPITLVDTLAEGEYYYRISTLLNFPEATKKVSTVRKFRINKRDLPQPVTLQSPTNNDKISYSGEISPKVKFIWEKSGDYINYITLITKDKDFKEILHTKDTTDNSVILESLQDGVYFWKVIGNSKEGNAKIESEINSFSILRQEKITLLAPDNKFEAEQEQIEIQWSKNPLTQNYLVDISSTFNFANPTKLEANTNLLQIKTLKAGKYFWRVKGFSEDPRIVPSSIREFTILPQPNLVILYPEKEENIDVSDLEKLELKWEKILQANSYQIKITNNLKNKIILEKETKESKFTIQDISIFKKGKYTFTLTANLQKKSGEIYSKSINHPFQISLPPIQKAKFNTPEEVYVE